MSAPGRWVWLLERVVTGADRAEVVRDMEEMHALRTERDGRAHADAWYRRQVMGFAWRALWFRAPRRKAEGRARRTSPFELLRQDTRLAARTLRRRPSYALVAAATLALGIGANTAVFSAVNGVLLTTFPYDEPDRLVRLFGYNVREGMDFGTISFPEFEDVRERARTLDGVAAYDEYRPLLTGGEAAERLNAASVSAAFFDVLGVRPAAGRFFTAEEEVPGSARSVVLSHGLWTRRYGAAPDIIGASIELNGLAYTVVGVTPADFEDPQLSASWGEPELWRVSPTYFGEAVRGGRSFTAIARLRDGVTQAQAQDELDGIMRALAGEYPDQQTNQAMVARPLLDTVVGDSRTPLLVLLVAAGLVLLIACANVANLALVRALDGERDFLVRAALGASRRRLAAQLLVENGMIALLAGAAGVAVAHFGVQALRALAGGQLARSANIAIDPGVLAFAILATLACGAAFGLAPLLAVSRGDVASGLREGGRSATTSSARRRIQRGLVVAEIALSCALLIGAGLLIRSLAQLQRVDTGVRIENTLTVPVFPPIFAYDTIADVTQLYRGLETRLAALPGVRAAGIIDILPMSGSFNGMGIQIEGRPEPPPGEGMGAETRALTAGVIDALGIQVVRGRGVEPTDRESSRLVALLNETAVTRFFPGEDPIGQRIRVFGMYREIVGVIRDVYEFSPDRAPEPGLYLPHEQAADWVRTNPAVLVLRTEGNPLALSGAVREMVRDIEPRAAIGEIQPMREVVAATVAAPRFRTQLLTTFAAVALLLAIVGIYGVVSRGVAQRRHELGIHMSLGADRYDVLGLVLREGMRPVVLGIGLGVAGGLAISRLLESLLFGVSAGDALTFVAAPVLLALTAGLACLLPAQRASRTDPATVLRVE